MLTTTSFYPAKNRQYGSNKKRKPCSNTMTSAIKVDLLSRITNMDGANSVSPQLTCLNFGKPSRKTQNSLSFRKKYQSEDKKDCQHINQNNKSNTSIRQLLHVRKEQYLRTQSDRIRMNPFYKIMKKRDTTTKSMSGLSITGNKKESTESLNSTNQNNDIQSINILTIQKFATEDEVRFLTQSSLKEEKDLKVQQDKGISGVYQNLKKYYERKYGRKTDN